MSAYLGVEASLTGRRWVGPGAERERQAEAEQDLSPEVGDEKLAE